MHLKHYSDAVISKHLPERPTGEQLHKNNILADEIVN